MQTASGWVDFAHCHSDAKTIAKPFATQLPKSAKNAAFLN
jgi:hypothetical protein